MQCIPIKSLLTPILLLQDLYCLPYKYKKPLYIKTLPEIGRAPDLNLDTFPLHIHGPALVVHPGRANHIQMKFVVCPARH